MPSNSTQVDNLLVFVMLMTGGIMRHGTYLASQQNSTDISGPLLYSLSCPGLINSDSLVNCK